MAREARYTENVSFLATADMKYEIEQIAGEYKVSAGDVWRCAVQVGLPATKEHFARAASAGNRIVGAASENGFQQFGLPIPAGSVVLSAPFREPNGE